MKLSLGAGKRVLRGYKNVDLAQFPHIDYVRSIDDLSCFEANSIEEIYASHCLEYYDFDDAISVLKEWRRVLKPGCSLRLSVPDFDKLIRVYQKENHDINKIIGPIFGRMPLNERTIYHKCVYTRNKLEETLKASGFVNIKEWEPLKYLRSIDKDYDDHSLAYYPHMDFDKGFSICLNIISEKTI